MKKNIALSLALLLSLNTTSLFAQDEMAADLGGFDTEEVSIDANELNESNDDLAGFGSEEVNETGSDLAGFGSEESEPLESSLSTISENPDQKPSIWRVSGNVAFKTSFGYKEHSVYAQNKNLTLTDLVDYSGFNQAQTSAYLQIDGKLGDNWKVRISGDAFYDAIYDLRTENNYNQDTLDAYRTQLRFDDVYIVGRLTSDMDLKVGRQIVVWGKSDSIRITDVINPIDNRLPAMTDIEDLRLPTTMAKLDYYVGAWNLSAMVIGESRIFIEGAPRGEFFPVDSIFTKPDGTSAAPDPFIELIQPDISLQNTQFAFAANGVFSGWDLSFYAANVLDQKWHIEGSLQTGATRDVSKVNMLGSAFNIVIGSWLLKSEIAYLDGIRYNSTIDAKARLDALIGFDYMGVKDTVLSLELANRHIFDYESQMQGINLGIVPDFLDQNEITTAMRVTRSFANDSINASVLVSMFGASWEYGGFTRVWVEYDVMDAVVANIGVVDYIGGDRPFTEAIKNNDRVFADIRYSF